MRRQQRQRSSPRQFSRQGKLQPNPNPHRPEYRPSNQRHDRSTRASGDTAAADPDVTSKSNQPIPTGRGVTGPITKEKDEKHIRPTDAPRNSGQHGEARLEI